MSKKPRGKPKEDGIREAGEVSTQRRHPRKKLLEGSGYSESIIDSLPGVFYVIDQEGVFLRWNKNLEDVSGYSAREVSRMSPFDFFQGPDSEKARDAIEEVFREGKSSMENQIVSRDGTKTPYYFTGVRKTFGRRTCLVGMAVDISDRKRMEEELVRVENLKSLGTLAGGIAHDFNNILTGIVANISMARICGDLPQDISEMLTNAESAAQRARELTQQLLTFARGGAPVTVPLNVAGLLQDTAEFALSGSNVKGEYDLPEDLWSVDADKGQISQVIQNIVINADQAMPEGGTFRIRAENLRPGGRGPLPRRRCVKISILDQGCGMPASQLPNIFDPFFSTKEKGRGLGLATTFSIINRHGGHVHVESEVGTGTTFNVFLPASSKASPPESAASRLPKRGRGRILLVDDDKIVTTSGREVLKRLGYEPETARDGSEGVDLYRAAKEEGRPYRAVIMDLTIPGGMGGKEAAREILRVDPRARLIVSSGYSGAPVMSEFRKHGFCAVLPKPYGIQDLSSTLLEVLSGMDG